MATEARRAKPWANFVPEDVVPADNSAKGNGRANFIPSDRGAAEPPVESVEPDAPVQDEQPEPPAQDSEQPNTEPDAEPVKEGICEFCGADFSDKPNPTKSLDAHMRIKHPVKKGV